MFNYFQFEIHDFPDRAIRHSLEDPDNLRELIAAAYSEFAARCNFKKIQWIPREFLMEDWRRRESDMIFLVPYEAEGEERPVLVCVLLEHQSKPDPRMPLRMLIYAVLYWEREWKEWEQNHAPGEPLRLTPIIPIVFHTGQEPWNTNRTLEELIDGPEELQKFVPQWPILFWDLAEQSVEELLKSTGEWLRSLAVVRAEKEDTEYFLGVLDTLVKELDALGRLNKMRWLDLLDFALSWALRRRPDDENRAIKDLAIANYQARLSPEEVQDVIKAFKTHDETLLERGLQKGRAEGEARGKILGALEGKVEACRENLRDLLTDRFGELPQEMLQKIDATDDLDRLKTAVRQAYRIASLDELPL